MKLRIALKIRKAVFSHEYRHRYPSIMRARMRLNATNEAFKHRHKVMDALTQDIDECLNGLAEVMKSFGMEITYPRTIEGAANV